MKNKNQNKNKNWNLSKVLFYFNISNQLNGNSAFASDVSAFTCHNIIKSIINSGI
jgi:hypothetical protein